jgi:hypothetical protein
LGDINIYQEVAKITSNFSDIINILGKQLEPCHEALEAPHDAFSIDNKIKYNNLISYRAVISELKMFVGKLVAIYAEFDKQSSLKKNNTLTNIKLHYIHVREEFKKANPDKSELEVIRENADAIFSLVEGRLLQEIRHSANIQESQDTINISLAIIMIDAFMRCKILEEPEDAAT